MDTCLHLNKFMSSKLWVLHASWSLPSFLLVEQPAWAMTEQSFQDHEENYRDAQDVDW